MICVVVFRFQIALLYIQVPHLIYTLFVPILFYFTSLYLPFFLASRQTELKKKKVTKKVILIYPHSINAHFLRT